MAIRGGLKERAAAVWRAVTPLGRAVAAAGLVLWLVAAATGWEELGVLAAGCLLALLIGLLFLLLANTKLTVLLELATPRVVAGDPASTLVEAVNDTGHRMLPARLEARVGKGVARVNVPALAAGASHDELLVIPTTRRSIVPVGPVRSVQGDPLGLVRREINWTGTEHLYVHPKTVVVGSLTTGWMRDLEGETTNDRSPSDVAFHTLREYVVGDDRRHIHWRTTARQPDGKLMVREFVDTRRAHLGLLLSLAAADYAGPDEFELAVSILGSLALRALADEQDVTCLAGAKQIPSFRGPTLLDHLAGVELGSDPTPPAAVAAKARDVLGSVSVAVIVTGSAADPAQWRGAVDRLGPSVHTIVAIAAQDREPKVTASAGALVVDVSDLADLPRLISTAAAS